MTSPVPNLFIIGAMKAGTSSLHEYLHQHPEIFMSRFKEPQYFAPHTTRLGLKWGQGNPHPEPGMDWYLQLFSGAGEAVYRGESSVSYTARPIIEDACERIHAFNSNARLIYLLRDPVERTLSHYWHNVTGGIEDLGMLQAVTSNPEYIDRSNYAYQLEPYLARFGRDQIFLLTLEELIQQPEDTFKRLFRWLGVNSDVRIDIDQRHNVGGTTLMQTRRGMVPVHNFLTQWRWKKWKSRFPASIDSMLRKLTYREVDRLKVDTAATIEFLRPIQQLQTEQLEKFATRDFAEWATLNPHPSAIRETTCTS